MNESNALERRAALLDVQGSQALIIHASMFMQLLAAQHAGNQQLASFYAERFPPDVKKAYEKWLAEKPFENRAADAHPFVPNLYQVRGTAEAAAARSDAATRVAQAREAGNRSGQFLANTVLFATVLFFAGTAGKFEQPRSAAFRRGLRRSGVRFCRHPNAPHATGLKTSPSANPKTEFIYRRTGPNV